MLPRERVALALNHKEPDRIPIDLGGTLTSSITCKAYAEVRRYLGMPEEEIRMLDYVQQLPFLGEDFQERFRSDFRLAQLPAITALGVNLTENGQYFELLNKWGTKLRMPREGGLYFDYSDFPIKEPTEAACAQYIWPPPNPPEYYRRLGEQAHALFDHTDYAVVGGVIIGGGIFEQPARLMGLENFFTLLVSEPKVADQMMEKVTEIYIDASIAYLDAVGGAIQVFTYWDDMCGQNGWLIRPELYTQMIKPKQRRLVEAIRAKTDAKLFYHGCGAVYDLIPHLIDIGFDIINPVQVSARGMDTRRLKQSFGKEIVFWGGGVDSQQVLPFGTPDQVADEVKRRIDDLAPGGGFVFDVVHNIQAFVPPENIVAAYETAYAYGRY